MFHITPTTTPTPDADRAVLMQDPGFGRVFTEHMAVASHDDEHGWHDLTVGPLRPFEMHPATSVLHYGQEVFEGLKAYLHDDGEVYLFRPERNAARFATSAARLALPVVPVEMFLASLDALVDLDRAWVPSGGETSLYVRPFLMGTETALAVRPSLEATYAVVASPSGAFFASGISGIRLWATTTYTRASPGGTGGAKTGGNYAGSMLAQHEARDHGCDQVLFTGGEPGRRTLDESGAMNILMVTTDGELLTPGLGTILEGVTRQSLLELASDHGLRPVERVIELSWFLDALRRGHITEVFAAGTAAVITPILEFRGDEFDDTIVGDGRPGHATLALREQLVGIQTGQVPDRRGWLHRVPRSS